MKVIRNISTVGGFTMISRVFGFVRDLLMARYLGAGMAADAFFIAFKLPNFFRRLFAEGAFSASFVPLFSRQLGETPSAEDKAKALDFAEKTLAILLPILLIFLIIMEWGMAQVIIGLTGGFDGDTQKFTLTTDLARLTFPYLLLISLVSLWTGMLNAIGHYRAAAFAPVILNICMITALLSVHDTQENAARMLAAAVAIAGLAQFLWLVWVARKAGIVLRLPLPRLTPEIKELFVIMGPAALGAGVMQLNLLIDVILAAHLLPEGSVSWLFYADRLNQLPTGVIGAAIITVLLPTVSRLLGSGADDAAQREQIKTITFALVLTVPAAVAFAIIPNELISTLFEREAFDAEDTAQTALALAAFSLGLPAYVLAKCLQPGYFARKDTRTPVKYGIMTVIVNLILVFTLVWPLAHVGMALATALSAWFNVGLLYWGLRKRGHLSLDNETLIILFKIVVCAALMGAVVWAAKDLMAAYFLIDGAVRIAALFGLISIGIISYFVLIFSTGALTKDSIKKALNS